MWDEITYPFLNLSGCTVEVYEWISNFILQFTGRVVNYPCWDQSSTMLIKEGPGAIEEVKVASMIPCLTYDKLNICKYKTDEIPYTVHNMH